MIADELPKDALVLLNDGDSIPYVLIHTLKFKDLENEDQMPSTDAVDSWIDWFITELHQQVGCTHIAGFVGGKGNFRYQVAKTKPYKGNRGDKTEFMSKWIQYISEYLVQKHNYQRADGIEADDAVCIANYELNEKGINHIICSNDKDLDQVAGNHYSMNKRQFYHIDEEQASLLLHTQLITGDPTDNIPGLPGKGKVYAQKLFEGKIKSEREAAIKWAYMNYVPNLGGGPVNFTGQHMYEEQKRLLTLVTHANNIVINYHPIQEKSCIDILGL
jgi:5'-3' exonuclease